MGSRLQGWTRVKGLKIGGACSQVLPRFNFGHDLLLLLNWSCRYLRGLRDGDLSLLDCRDKLRGAFLPNFRGTLH